MELEFEASPLEPRQEEIRDYLHRAYAEANKDLKRDHWQLEHSGPVIQSVSEMCDAVQHGQDAGRYFAVRPRRGLSMVFWHLVEPGAGGAQEEEELESSRVAAGSSRRLLSPENGDHWHSGCPVGGTVPKVIHLRFAFPPEGRHEAVAVDEERVAWPRSLVKGGKWPVLNTEEELS